MPHGSNACETGSPIFCQRCCIRSPASSAGQDEAPVGGAFLGPFWRAGQSLWRKPGSGAGLATATGRPAAARAATARCLGHDEVGFSTLSRPTKRRSISDFLEASIGFGSPRSVDWVIFLIDFGWPYRSMHRRPKPPPLQRSWPSTKFSFGAFGYMKRMPRRGYAAMRWLGDCRRPTAVRSPGAPIQTTRSLLWLARASRATAHRVFLIAELPYSGA